MGAEGFVLTALAVIAGLLLVAGLIQAFRTPARRRVRYAGIRYRGRAPARRGEAAPAARRAEPGPDLRSFASPAPARHPPAGQEGSPASDIQSGLASGLPFTQASPRRWRASARTATPAARPKPLGSNFYPAPVLPSEPVDVGPPSGDPVERTDLTAPQAPPAALALEPDAAPDDLARDSPRPEAPMAAGAAPLPLEECFTLYQGGQYAELLEIAEPPLQAAAEAEGSPGRSPGFSALWSLVGLAKEALNDEEGGRAAFQEAFLAAPEADRQTYLSYRAALTEAVEEERFGPLRREVLWVAYGHLAEMLVERQEFLRARRLVWEALGDEELPEDRREALKGVLSRAYAREIEQLTADAGAAVRDERDGEALELLQRADGLLASIPDGTLTSEHGAELQRCVWERYQTLGVHRMKAGAADSALELLLRALTITPADSASQRETRTALVRALEAVVDASADEVGRLLKDGQRAAAFAESERLLGVIREGMAAGLSAEEIGVPLAKARRAINQVLPD